MVRFRVVKGSHILLALAILVLAAVLLAISLQCMDTMEKRSEAKVVQTFASADIEKSALTIRVIPEPSPSPAPTNGKRILIYHTHTHEAYSQTEEDPYEAVETWRTEDEDHSVVRLGSVLAGLLKDKGHEVIHDRTDHEQQDISNAYVRSLETLEGYETQFDLIIDLHRDAYVPSLPISLEHEGKEYAQLMMLVGRGDNYADADKPDYDGNLRFAQRLTSALNARMDSICRNVTVKQGRYNQHIGRRAILVEVGHNRNTLAQALNSIPVLAEALEAVLGCI